MKARIFEIKRFAVHDGEGIRTTVFFKGCPLKCVWCHNPEGISSNPEIGYYSHKCINCGECVKACPNNAHRIKNGKHIFDKNKCLVCGNCVDACLGSALTLYGQDFTVDELLPILLKDVEFYNNSNGGVTLSGGECLLYADFCAELLKKLKEHGINTAVDTCGFVNKNALDKVIPYTDVFLYDVKAIDENVHKKCTGQSNQTILENLLYLEKKGCKIQIRFPYVPNYNDEEIESFICFIKRLNNVSNVDLLSYHNLARSKYQALDIIDTLSLQLPTKEEIEIAKDKIKKGLS